MDTSKICMGCMNDKGSDRECSICGFVEGELGSEIARHLPLRTLLKGQYLLGRILGSGGFGITYLAWDLVLQTKVAVKEFFPSDLATRVPGNSVLSVYSGAKKESFEHGKQAFLDEARKLARFDNNPGIVSVRSYFEANSTAYIVMNYIEGLTLKEYLELKGDYLSVHQAISIMYPVMKALAEVHDAGILHRDISPDNIYLTDNGQIKLLDFGAARYAIGGVSQSLSVILKHGYAPFEQYQSRGQQGPWTDVYAIGATIYRIVSGKTIPEALERLEGSPLDSLSVLDKVSPQFEIVLNKALEVRPNDRYQSMNEFLDAMKNSMEISEFIVDKSIMPKVAKNNLSKVILGTSILTLGDTGDVPQVSSDHKNTELINTSLRSETSRTNKDTTDIPSQKTTKEKSRFFKILRRSLAVLIISVIVLVVVGVKFDLLAKYGGKFTSANLGSQISNDLGQGAKSASTLPEQPQEKPGSISLLSSENNLNTKFMSDEIKPFTSEGKVLINPTSPSLKLGGNEYSKGYQLQFSQKGAMSFNLESELQSIGGLLGLDDSTSNVTEEVTIIFSGDEKPLGQYSIKPGGLPQQFIAKTSGVKKLEIRASSTSTSSLNLDFANVIINGNSNPTEATVIAKTEEISSTVKIDEISGKYMSDVLPPYFSTGEIKVNPGSPLIRLAGIDYFKGYQFSFYKSGEMAFNLEGKQQSISGLLGIDDNHGILEEIALVVTGDEKTLGQYSIKPGNLPQQFTVDVSGVKKLSMKASCNSGNRVYLDLANMMINVNANRVGLTNNDKLDNVDGKYLSDVLNPYFSTMDVKANPGSPLIKLAGKDYFKGYQLHFYKDGQLNFNLAGKIQTISGLLGLDDTYANSSEEVTIAVSGDDKQLAQYSIKPGSQPQQFSIDVKGVAKLTIRSSSRSSNRVYLDLADVVIH